MNAVTCACLERFDGSALIVKDETQPSQKQLNECSAKCSATLWAITTCATCTLRFEIADSQTATTYSAVGISGCEPPQPQEYPRKIHFISDLSGIRRHAFDDPQPFVFGSCD